MAKSDQEGRGSPPERQSAFAAACPGSDDPGELGRVGEVVEAAERVRDASAKYRRLLDERKRYPNSPSFSQGFELELWERSLCEALAALERASDSLKVYDVERNLPLSDALAAFGYPREWEVLKPHRVHLADADRWLERLECGETLLARWVEQVREVAVLAAAGAHAPPLKLANEDGGTESSKSSGTPMPFALGVPYTDHMGVRGYLRVHALPGGPAGVLITNQYGVQGSLPMHVLCVDSKARSTGRAEGGREEEAAPGWTGKVLALLFGRGRDWRVPDLARSVGKHPSSLYRDERIGPALKARRHPGSSIQAGSAAGEKRRR